MTRIYLALGLALAIAACNSPETNPETNTEAPPDSTEVIEEVDQVTTGSNSQSSDSTETDSSTADSPEQNKAAADASATPSSAPETPAATATPPKTAAQNDKASTQATNKPSSQTVNAPQTEKAADAKTATAKAASEKAAPEKATTEKGTTEIAIDESVCGAGGQAAYFETGKQEIYICRSENQSLTYIATPKKKGNSVFLPATAVQDGKKTGYVAEDGDRRFLISPAGYRLEENGKAINQEKVIRNR